MRMRVNLDRAYDRGLRQMRPRGRNEAPPRSHQQRALRRSVRGGGYLQQPGPMATTVVLLADAVVTATGAAAARPAMKATANDVATSRRTVDMRVSLGRHASHSER